MRDESYRVKDPCVGSNVGYFLYQLPRWDMDIIVQVFFFWKEM